MLILSKLVIQTIIIDAKYNKIEILLYLASIILLDFPRSGHIFIEHYSAGKTKGDIP